MSDTPTSTNRKLKDLPLPRLQLTWRETPDDPEYGWACDYELLVPLSKYDIRNNGKRGKVGGPGFIRATLGGCKSGGGSGPLYNPQVGSPVLNTPYRDGAHAAWDSFRLGFPAFVVLEKDGVTYTRFIPSLEPN